MPGDDPEPPLTDPGGDDGPGPPVDASAAPPYGISDTIHVGVEAAFPEVRRLKVVGAILFVLAGVTAVLPILMLEGGTQLTVETLGALVLAAAGIAWGIAGLFSPAFRRHAIVAGPVLLLTAAAASSPGASLDRIPPEELALAFAFAVTWLLVIEHIHAVMRFIELGAYVTRQRLEAFRLSGVVNHFQVYGFGLIGIIVAITSIVVVGIPWVLAQGSDGTFGRSVELNSVFGVALAATVVFTLSSLILFLVRSVLPQRVEVERVAYSREKLEDMLRSSHLMEDQREGKGR